MGRLFRVLVGFIAACLAAGFTKVLFVTTPVELANLPSDVAGDQMAKALNIALAVATQSAIFSAPFALVAAAIGEWRGIRNWAYYAVVGVLIALIGFMAQYSGEAQGQPTIVNNYAMTAFLTAGFMAGLFYWLFAGRGAGGPEPAHQAIRTVEAAPPKAAPKPAPSAKPASGGATPPSGATPKKA
jgi:drug/metabolite transporter (DMT)-like permease